MATPAAPRWRLRAALGGCFVLALVFCALAAWQWQRLQWKQGLLARVDVKQLAAPAAAPGPAQWPALQRSTDEYRAVQLRGRLDHTRETRVLASTELGRGHWVMTPLRTEAGWWLWVNRGYVDDAHAAPASRPPAAADEVVALRGLLRWREAGWLPGLGNNPATGRWLSRDVPMLSTAAGLPEAGTAPYFLDVWPEPGEAPRTAQAWPRNGLTVLNFSNHHLGYALTWAALALGALGAAGVVWRHGQRPRG